MASRRELSDASRCLAVVAALSVPLTGCDPVRLISTSREVGRPLDQSCTVRVLRSSELVEAAGVSDQGIVYVNLVVPENLESPDPAPQVLVRETSNDREKTEVTFYVSWVGGKGSVEYRRYVEGAVETLQTTTIEACSGRAF